MKNIFVALVSLFITGIAFSQQLNQTGKLSLAPGQKIIIDNNTEITATLTMGMELNGTTKSTNLLEVKTVADKDAAISSSITKLKADINMMGQANSYDSDNKSSNNAEMAKLFDDKLNNPVDVDVNITTGKGTAKTKISSKTDADESNPGAEMMNVFSDNTDEAIVSGAFAIIPEGTKVGDSWTETIKTKDLKTTRTYTLNAVNGNEANIQLNIVSNAVNKMEYMGMEFEIKTETKTKGEIISDMTTGLVKSRTTKADITGSLPMMGQDMPISGTVNSTTTYK